MSFGKKVKLKQEGGLLGHLILVTLLPSSKKPEISSSLPVTLPPLHFHLLIFKRHCFGET